MTIAIPAATHVACPKCQQMNAPGQSHIMEAHDERGKHYECKSCGIDFRLDD